MAKKIRFPLIMKDGIQVRTIEELRENFDLEKVIEYFLDGKLKAWLNQRSYFEELELINKLNIDSKNIPSQLCSMCKVICFQRVDVNKIIMKENREKLLKEYADSDDWKDKIDYIAFNQSELEILVKKNNKIYLVGDEFIISNELADKQYIGINKPILKLKFSDKYKNNDKTITFKNVILKSDSEINTCANIEKDCDVDENSIKTFARYTNDIKVYNAEDLYHLLNNVGSYYIGTFHRDLYLINNHVIYIVYDKIISINLNTLESKEIYNDLRLCNLYSKCSHKVKDKILIIEKSMVYMFNGTTMKIEKKLFENSEWIEKDLNCSYKIFDENSKNKLIVYSNYTSCNYKDDNVGMYEFDLDNKDIKSSRLGEKYLKDGKCCIANNKLYILDGDRKIVEFDEKNKRTIELEPPQTEGFIKKDSLNCARVLDKFIVKDNRVFVIWACRNMEGHSLDMGFNYGVYNEYNKYILVYDLYSKEIAMSKKAHDIGIVLIYEINNILFTIDILGCLKMWNIDNLDLIGTIQLVNFDDCDYDDLYKYNPLIESVSYKEKFYMCHEIVGKMKETVIDYDELSDRILIKYLDKVFILG